MAARLLFLWVRYFSAYLYFFKNLSSTLPTLLPFPVKKFFFLVACNLLLSLSPGHSLSDFKVGSVIIDEEINTKVTEWLQQLFKVAGLKQYRPNVYLVVNPELNAAASLGGQIIIHTGLIENCVTTKEFLAVLAHEVGHIAGGHLAKMDQAAQGAALPAAAALLLGGAAALATGNPTPLIAGLSGGQHLFHRGMLSFTRAQESSADQAAMTYLDKLGWGTQGLLDFFKVIDHKTSALVRGIDPYAVTHPLTTERIKSVEEHLASTKPSSGIPEKIDKDYQRIRAKVIGFFAPANRILKEDSYLKTLSAEDQTYAKAIAHYRLGEMSTALANIDSLLKERPEDPYLYELKGQIQLDNGNHTAAIQSLEMAVKKHPRARYIKVLLAQALLERDTPHTSEKALKLLTPLVQQDADNAFAWRLLATAHGRLNNSGQASLALAEEALISNDVPLAKRHATDAKKKLKPGPALQRAEDLLASLKPS